MPKEDKVSSIDSDAIQSFLDGTPTKEFPESEHFKKKIEDGYSIAYNDELGTYTFTWGEIQEIISERFYIWKFNLSALDAIKNGNKSRAQEEVFVYLHKRYPKQSSDSAILVSSIHTRCIFKAQGDEAFIVAAPAAEGQPVRFWIYTNLIEGDLQKIIEICNHHNHPA